MSTPIRKMVVSIESPPDREKLVAGLLYEDEQWAEVNQEFGVLHLEIYPRRDGQPWRFSFDEAFTALQAAKHRLIGGTQ